MLRIAVNFFVLTLQESTPEAIKNILDRQLASKNAKYEPEIRSFALTLHFYSPKAYSFVRDTFKNLLPHPTTIKKWYAVVNCETGFTKEAFEALNSKAKDSPVVVNLVIDEISIRQQIEYDGKKYRGFVDLGTNLDSDSENRQPAKNALVFMAVAINNSWKVPLAYFFINSLKSQERANLIKICLELIHESGAKCYSVTFDGARTNISMCQCLGADFELGKMFLFVLKLSFVYNYNHYTR